MAQTDAEADEVVPADTPAVAQTDAEADVVDGGGLIEAQLGQLPLRLLDDAEGSATVSIVDIQAAARQAGVDDPIDLDDEAAIDALVTLTLPTPVDEGGTGFGVVQPFFFPAEFGIRDPQAFEDELGFSPLDITTFAEFTAPPASFSVVSGDLEVSADLVETAPGIATAGAGADYEANLDERTEARPLGRPHHLATRGDLVAVSLDLPSALDWVDGADSLADDARWAAVARQLDASNVAGAMLLHGDFSVGETLPPGEAERVPITSPFDLVAMGSSRIDGQAAVTIVYHFGDETAAAAEADNVAAAWTGVSLLNQQPLTDLISNLRIDQVGSTVTVVGDVGDGTSTRALQSSILAGDLPVLHR